MSNATTLRDNITASNPYITGIKGTLTAAISTANDVYTNSASALEVSTATTTLHTAETAFTDAMTPYNTYVTYIGTVTSGRDAEARTAPFFTAIKAPLTSAISTATDAELTVTSTTDISDAKTALQTAYTQFTTDKPAYDNLNTQISTVTSRLAIANARKGDSRFLMFPTATVQTLTDANTTATTALGSETTVSGLSTAQSTLTTALNAFNTAARVGTGTSYYRIYTNGADNGDGTTTKSILFAEGTTLKYTPSSSALNANSIWEITEGTTIGTYTIKNVGTGNYFYCPSTTTISLNSTSTLFTLPEGYSQTNLIKYGSDTYFVYYIVNPSNKGLEVDSFNTVLTGVNKGKFLINSAAANRFRFCYQFEPVKTWKGVSGNWSETANWSDAIAPTTEDVVVGTGSVTLDQDATPANLMIATGAQVTVNAGKKLTTTSTFANNGTINLLSNETDGTATTLSGAGTATVQQYLTSGRNWYVSSPVAAATTSALSSASSINYYDEPSAAFVAFSIESPLSPLKGYISAGTVTSGAVTFSGTLNDGVQTVTLPRTSGVTKSGFNLVGNPYPSYLNWDLVQQTNMDPTMWYRTMNAGATAYVFDTYNSTSQLGTGNNGETVNSNIPPMQAFWVRVKAALDGSTTSGTLTFNNSMRTHKGSQTANSVTTPDVKLKSRAVANVTQQVLRLQVSNGTNSDEAIVYFNPNASDGLDDYDSPKMSNANAAIPEIYTIAGTEKLVINGLSVVTPEETLPLGFTTGQSNSFSIKATQIANFDGMKVYLRDNVLNTEQELTDASSYTFTSDIATTTTRFSVVFKSAGVTTGINASTNQTVVINKNANNQITVNCNGAINSDSFVSVYNALGQKVSAQQITASNTIISSSFKPGVYVVTVNNGNKTTTKKVILN